ncbi:MAG: hypothetical protein LBS06_06535 [Treponema sp.]|jgi:hypothetical protein|nr:hypothetical protein [Treponema sp.]
MSDINNPWQSPETQVAAGDTSRGVITEGMLRYLKEASPWLRFVGIISFIAGGLLCLSGIGLIVTGTGYGMSALRAFGALGGLGGLVYLASGVVVFFPAKFMYSFGSRIRQYAGSGAAVDLEQALKNNKSLWKFSGILCIIYLALIPLAIVGAIIVAAVV